MTGSTYWTRLRNRRLSRRAVLRSAATAGVGAAGLALVGCGDDDDDQQAAAQQQAQPEQQQDAAAQAADQAEQQEQAMQQQQQQAAVAQAQQQEGPPPMGGELRISDTSDLASFDMFLTFGYKAALHGHNCYPMLTQFSNNPGQSSIDFQPELWLAESAEQPDDTTWLFTIKENAVWEDREPVNGRAVTAEDVAFSWSGDRYANYPNRGAIQPSLVGVEATDDRTVQVRPQWPARSIPALPRPSRRPLCHAAGAADRRDVAADDDQCRTRSSSMSTSRARASSTSAIPPISTRPSPNADSLVINFISDNSAIAAAFLTGELNTTWFGVAPPIVEELEEQHPRRDLGVPAQPRDRRHLPRPRPWSHSPTRAFARRSRSAIDRDSILDGRRRAGDGANGPLRCRRWPAGGSTPRKTTPWASSTATTRRSARQLAGRCRRRRT